MLLASFWRKASIVAKGDRSSRRKALAHGEAKAEVSESRPSESNQLAQMPFSARWSSTPLQSILSLAGLPTRPCWLVQARAMSGNGTEREMRKVKSRR
jgi:hypothetical protein